MIYEAGVCKIEQFHPNLKHYLVLVVNQRWQLLFPFIVSIALSSQIFRNAILFRFLNLSSQPSSESIMPQRLSKAVCFKIIAPIIILLSRYCHFNHFNKQSATSRHSEFLARILFKFPPAKSIKIPNSKNFETNISQEYRFAEDNFAKFRIAETKHGRNWFEV